MKQITVLLGLLLTFIAMGQSNLTTKQIQKKNYLEVIGDVTNPANTIKPDKYAMYPDGINGIHEHIMKNLTYPQNALNKGIQGKVILKFVVEKDGSIQNIEVIQSIDPELDAEAIRVLKKLDIWVPGYKNDKPVKVEYRFPFNFKL